MSPTQPTWSEQIMARTRLVLHTSQPSVLLREFVPADADPLFALIDTNRTHLSQFGDTTAKKYPTYGHVLESIVRPADPNKIRLGIWWDSILTGTISLTLQQKTSAKIGYWLANEFCKNGLAADSVSALVVHARRLLGVAVIGARTHKDNHASQAVLKRAGFWFLCQVENYLYFEHP